MNNNINDLTIITVIDLIGSGELKVKDLATFFGKSERTIQKHIKGLGYIWDSKERKYIPKGEEYNSSNDNKLFSEVVNPNILNSLKTDKGRKNSTKKDNKKKTNNVTKNSNVDSIDDSIDSILFGKSTNNGRVQRAYYLDTDIAGIIDKIDGKQKSNLVNDCLRKVFKEKGLL